MLKTFEEKVSYAIEKIKALKEEKAALEKQLEELRNIVRLRDQEIERMSSEKVQIRGQLEGLFNELESIELK